MLSLKNQRLRWRAATLAIYVLVACWATWPLATKPMTHFQQGSMTTPTVPLLNIWTTWWNSDRALHGGSDYWNSPIFFPRRHTFALSEPQPTMLIVSPVIWLTGSRVLAYNIYLWLALILNGVCGARLLKRLGVIRPVAIAGGLAMMLVPYVHWQRDVIQLVPLWGILWTLTATLKLAASPTKRAGVETGVAFSLTCLSCLHYGLFLVIPLGLASLVLIRWKSGLGVLTAALMAVIVTCVIVGPFAWTIRRETSAEHFQRVESIVEKQSAQPIDYVSSREDQWLAFQPPTARKGRGLSAGWATTMLAICGLGISLRFRRWRRRGVFLLVILVAAFLMSLGPNLRIGGWEPWWSLTTVLPIFARVRNVFRFAVMVQIVVTLCAFLAVHQTIVIVLARRLAKGPRRIVVTMACLLGGIAIFETPPPGGPLSTAPNIEQHRNWIAYVDQQVPAGQGIVSLPMASGSKVSAFAVTTKWMYLGSYHKRPLLNGYSGYFPAHYYQFRRDIDAGFPTQETLALLAGSHMEFVVVDRHAFTLDAMEDTAAPNSRRLDCVYSDPIGIDVYRITRLGPETD